MTSPNVLERVIAILQEAGVAHMLTGSSASAYHGGPRATQDLHFVIDADREQLERLILLPSHEWYVDQDAGVGANHGQPPLSTPHVAFSSSRSCRPAIRSSGA